MISSLRSRESTASHSSFLSQSSRRERAEAPARAAALSAKAAVVRSCWVGSLGLAELFVGFGCWRFCAWLIK